MDIQQHIRRSIHSNQLSTAIGLLFLVLTLSCGNIASTKTYPPLSGPYVHDDYAPPMRNSPTIAFGKTDVTAHPKSAHSLMGLGLAYYKQKQYSQAVNAFNISLAIKPTNINCWLYLGCSYRATGELSKARDSFAQGAKRSSERVRRSFFSGLEGDAAWDIGDQASAHEAYKRVLADRPNDGLALIFEAQFAATNGDNDRAKTLFERASINNQDSPRNRAIEYAGLGRLWEQDGNQPRARNYFEKSLKVDATNAWALHGLKN